MPENSPSRNYIWAWCCFVKVWLSFSSSIKTLTPYQKMRQLTGGHADTWTMTIQGALPPITSRNNICTVLPYS